MYSSDCLREENSTIFLPAPQRESALELAAAYYANTISAWLVGESQELQQILLQQNGKSASTFSKIMQHSELKALQLEETPWVAEAREESSAQAAITQLADQNSMAFRRAEMLRRPYADPYVRMLAARYRFNL